MMIVIHVKFLDIVCNPAVPEGAMLLKMKYETN